MAGAQQTTTRLPAGRVTFVMTDIEGSTRLFEGLGEQFVALLEIHNVLLRHAFESHRGVEFDTEGDALVVAFDDAAQALAGCLDGQLALRSHAWPPGAAIRVRMGLHTAEARPTGNNYVSLGLHQTARICTAGHGGQILLSEATAAEVTGRLPADVSLSTLGSFQLRGFAEPARLFQANHPRLPVDFPPPRVQGVVHHNLPFYRAGFVGRSRERAALAELIRQTGVLTVVGMGGVGKTRLSVQLAFDVMDDFDDGAWLVELAPVTDRQGVASAVASALHVTEVPGRSLEDAVIDDLSTRSALIVLDNCEQLLEAAAGFTEALTQRSPQVVVVATSREPLRLEGEVVWRLEPWPVLEPAEVTSTSAVVAQDAVRLFGERATLVRPGFTITDDNAMEIARIVHHLDGIPLAIELAAAALADRSVEGVLDGLSDRFSLLTGGRRTAPQRHKTLRAALEWSLDLLGPDERLLFGRLATFARTGTIDAVRAVCGTPPLSDASVPHLVRGLFRASLLSPRDDPGRWTMLESVHELADLELTATGESAALAERHRDWLARHVETLGRDVGLRGRRDAVTALVSDLPNIRQALTTAITAGDGDRALRTATAMTPFWISHGDWTAGIEHHHEALGLPAGAHRLRGPALAALGSLLILQGEMADAEAAFRQADEIASLQEDETTQARSRSGLGYVAFRNSALDEAEARWSEALGHAERAGDERVAAGILRSLAIAAGSRGDQVRAGRLLDGGIHSAEHAEDDQLLRLLLGSKAEIELWLGHYAAAQALYGQALDLASTIGDLSARPLLLSELGWVAFLGGDLTTSHRLASEASQLAEDLGNRRTLTSALRVRGEGLVRRGRFVEAEVDLQQALAVAEALSAPADIAGVLCAQAHAALEQHRVTEAARLAESAVSLSTLGHTMRDTFPQWVLGVVALSRGDLLAAEQLFRAEAEDAITSSAPRHQANSRWGLARVSSAAGQAPDAARLHREALSIRHRIGDRLGVAESLLGSAGVVATVDQVTASDLVAAAQRLHTELGAVMTPRLTGDLEVIRSLLGGHEVDGQSHETGDDAQAVERAVRALRALEGSGAARAG
ncbi:ATP-binding protein [Ornithinimicrobium cryptoxanthini]|uniref:ATP-binding protein n=1 Tax=Ornithinimicrobium cryptoxanthini TaxID=2934161 RepID=UPI0021198E0B|nr:adenylate/guanylate cyclase domain-containing protein [Ornithinimicrobium cryptoxanthini]